MSSIPRWFFNPGQSKCEPFYWSGCCANSNNFASQELCQNTCEGCFSLLKMTLDSGTPQLSLDSLVWFNSARRGASNQTKAYQIRQS
ncbi:unnamed protein product [Meloidogyne enterolobii]|uniref:Uncharacterized protein n=1 Tax=Meloidogyne enterolobii TaxID=390850 RepID=A0ACB0Y5Y8_MELEN